VLNAAFTRVELENATSFQEKKYLLGWRVESDSYLIALFYQSLE
jgi:hypothetical protein